MLNYNVPVLSSILTEYEIADSGSYSQKTEIEQQAFKSQVEKVRQAFSLLTKQLEIVYETPNEKVYAPVCVGEKKHLGVKKPIVVQPQIINSNQLSIQGTAVLNIASLDQENSSVILNNKNSKLIGSLDFNFDCKPTLQDWTNSFNFLKLTNEVNDVLLAANHDILNLSEI